MIHPSYTELMTVVNGDNEENEKPVVQSRYSIVLAAAKRARQIIDGAETTVADKNQKPLSIAVEEIYERKIEILPNDDDFDETEEAEEAEELVEE